MDLFLLNGGKKRQMVYNRAQPIKVISVSVPSPGNANASAGPSLPLQPIMPQLRPALPQQPATCPAGQDNPAALPASTPEAAAALA
jgi:hypothetical protein